MKKIYANPEISFTSFEAASDIMVNTLSSVQTSNSITPKKYSEINFS